MRDSDRDVPGPDSDRTSARVDRTIGETEDVCEGERRGPPEETSGRGRGGEVSTGVCSRDTIRKKDRCHRNL